MRAPDLEMIQTLTVLVVRTPLLIWWARRDERSMTETELERAWQPTTRDLATVLIGSLALFIHSLKARRNWKGAALGLAAMVVAEVATFALLTAEEAVLDVLVPTAAARVPRR